MNSALLFSIALFCACAVGCQGEQYIGWGEASTAVFGAATATTQRPAYPTYHPRRNNFSHPYPHSYPHYPYPSRHSYPSYPYSSPRYTVPPRYPPRFRDSTQVDPTKPEGTEAYLYSYYSTRVDPTEPEGTEAYVYSHYNSSAEVEDRNSTIDFDYYGGVNYTRFNDSSREIEEHNTTLNFDAYDRLRELFYSTFYGGYGSNNWRLSMTTSTPSPSSTTDGSQLHSKPLSDRVVVEMPGSLAADQDLHFALSLVPMLRQRSMREKIGTEVDILNYFRSKLRHDRN